MFCRATLTLDAEHAERILELYTMNKIYRAYSATRMSACANSEAITTDLMVSRSQHASNVPR